MGTGSSKPQPIAAPSLDMSKATFTGDYVSQLASASANAIKTANTQITTATSSSNMFRIISILVGVIAVIFAGILIWDFATPDNWTKVLTNGKIFSSGAPPPPPPPPPAPPASPPPSTSSPGPVSPTPLGSALPSPTNPTLLSRFSSYFMDTSSSGDFLPNGRTAQTSSSIQGSKAPLSSQQDGAYSMQWWMFVKDWNYGYGKEKSIVKRPDPTNPAIHNPHISLHPTDNSMKISVSVFPTNEGGSSKTEPAPAGHSGSTDDVYICEVPDIPLQSWFSVSVSIFGRNLDVYINGNLVKSCFLSGVPKPAIGDINLTPDGGFSGKICNFYHFSRMLTPGDAMTFFNKGTSCKNDSGTENTSSATGYSVKFGVYDALGKEIQEYAF
jgi:hypothetical protein